MSTTNMNKILIDEATVKLALETLENINSADNDRDFLGPEECCDLDKAITALQEALAEQPAQQTCNCRWEDEVQVQQCTLHEAHVDAIHEWAGRAKAAEAKLKEKNA